MVLMGGPDEEEQERLRRVVELRLADGIVICETRRFDSRIDYLLRRRPPSSRSAGACRRRPYSSIDLDFEGVAERAIERLAALGHRKIALAVRNSEVNYNFGSSSPTPIGGRCSERGLAVDPALIFEEEGTQEGGYRLGATLLAMPERPTALILVHNPMTVGLYRRLTEAGLTPGKDLAIIGFQDESSGRFLSPRLTAFRSDLGALGVRLGEAMLAAMPDHAEKQPAEPLREVWPMELVAGESDGRAGGFLPRAAGEGDQRSGGGGATRRWNHLDSHEACRAPPPPPSAVPLPRCAGEDSRGAVAYHFKMGPRAPTGRLRSASAPRPPWRGPRARR